jgi:DNA topoisomerase 2-associated protein PAT1
VRVFSSLVLFLGALEGTLGKITSLSSRNPRQSLQVSDKKANLSDETGPVAPEQASSHDHAHLATVSCSIKKHSTVGRRTHERSLDSLYQGKHTTLNDRRRVLTIVEGLYLKVLELEQMRRQGPSRSRRDDEEEQERRAEEWYGQAGRLD